MTFFATIVSPAPGSVCLHSCHLQHVQITLPYLLVPASGCLEVLMQSRCAACYHVLHSMLLATVHAVVWCKTGKLTVSRQIFASVERVRLLSIAPH
jgi:hypothetical protein